jgi:hypothetical protein
MYKPDGDEKQSVRRPKASACSALLGFGLEGARRAAEKSDGQII